MLFQTALVCLWGVLDITTKCTIPTVGGKIIGFYVRAYYYYIIIIYIIDTT